MSLNPITREEKFLAKAGGEDVGELKPITRREQFLDRLAGGGGGDVSWNDLKDKPFGETVEDVTISFDCGNTEGLEFVEMMAGYGLYKISDLVPTKEDLLGAAFISNMGNSDILAGDIEIRGDGNIQIFGSIFIVSDCNAITMPITSNGVWFNYNPSMQGMVFDLKYTARTIKTLDPKFLPVPFGDELVEILPETEVEFVYDDAEAMWAGMFQAPKVVGNENNYVVVYNGVEYRGTSAHGSMGNTAIAGGEDNGMPFFIMPIDESGGHLIVSLDELPKTTVSIKEFVSTPIPSKYMPEYEVLDLISLGVGELTTTNKKYTINFSDFTFLERAYKKGIIKIRVSVPIKYGTTENIGERIIWGFVISYGSGYNIHCPIAGGQLYIDVNAAGETLSVTYDQFLLKS